MSRATRLSAAVLATALGFAGLTIPAGSAFAAAPAPAANTSAPDPENPAAENQAAESQAAARGTADVIQFQDVDLDNAYDEGEPDFHQSYLNVSLTLQNKDTGTWYVLLPSVLKEHGLPEGDYTIYLHDNRTSRGNHVFVDTATGKRMPRRILPNRVPATRIGSDGKEYTNGVTAGYGGHYYQDITLSAGKPLSLKYAASMIGMETRAVETVDGAEVDATDKLKVTYRDDKKAVKTTPQKGKLFAGDGSESYTRYHFTGETLNAILLPNIDYAIDTVEARRAQSESPRRDQITLSDPLPLEASADGLAYSLPRTSVGDSWGQVAIDVKLKKVETGTVNLRLFRDENLDSQYSGEGEEIHSGYVNLVDENGRWFKVTPESLAKQGLPAGTYTAYLRNAGIADGFGATVNSATGERLQTVRLDQRHDATYVDPATGETVQTVTDTGRFVETPLTITAGETTDADFAHSRIDSSVAFTVKGESIDPAPAVKAVYFKDGATELSSFASGDEFLASSDAAAKTRHFFTDEWVTVRVETKTGYRVHKVSVVPSATYGGQAIKAQRLSANEYRIKRSEMGDDFGRFEFSVELKKHPKGK